MERRYRPIFDSRSGQLDFISGLSRGWKDSRVRSIHSDGNEQGWTPYQCTLIVTLSVFVAREIEIYSVLVIIIWLNLQSRTRVRG